jgi:hypothetical protein
MAGKMNHEPMTTDSRSYELGAIEATQPSATIAGGPCVDTWMTIVPSAHNKRTGTP